MPFELPKGLKPEDEFRHSPKKGAENLLYGDTLWVSVVDPEAGIHGVNHFHLTNKGFARFEALYVIDGVVQLYANKIPLDPKPDNGPWSDGRLEYEVVDPFEHIRISFDWKTFAFDLDFKGRFAPSTTTTSTCWSSRAPQRARRSPRSPSRTTSRGPAILSRASSATRPSASPPGATSSARPSPRAGGSRCGARGPRRSRS